MAAKRVDTLTFENSHGHSPRGYGLWMFELTVVGRHGLHHQRTFQTTATYGEAKQQALALLTGGWSDATVTVLP